MNATRVPFIAPSAALMMVLTLVCVCAACSASAPSPEDAGNAPSEPAPVAPDTPATEPTAPTAPLPEPVAAPVPAIETPPPSPKPRPITIGKTPVKPTPSPTSSVVGTKEVAPTGITINALSRGKGVPAVTREAFKQIRALLERQQAAGVIAALQYQRIGLEGESRLCVEFRNASDAQTVLAEIRRIAADVELLNVVEAPCPSNKE